MTFISSPRSAEVTYLTVAWPVCRRANEDDLEGERKPEVSVSCKAPKPYLGRIFPVSENVKTLQDRMLRVLDPLIFPFVIKPS